MKSQHAIDLYLDLMKSTLNFALWPEPPVPIEAFMYRKSAYKRLLIAVSSRLLGLKNLQLFEKRNLRADARDEGRFWPGLAHTMIGRKRLDNLQYCVETALRDQVEGDMIETGVWRGGACILMRAILAAHEVKDRRVFVADSFEGLPEPDEAKYPVDRGDTHHIHTFLAISQSEVENNFRSYGLLDEQVVFLKGWFEDTLPKGNRRFPRSERNTRRVDNNRPYREVLAQKLAPAWKPSSSPSPSSPSPRWATRRSCCRSCSRHG